MQAAAAAPDRTAVCADSGPSATLIALENCLTFREYRLGPAAVVIGRDAGQCEIVAAGPTVSRRHLRIVAGDDGGFVIEDLQSTNGVFVNGRRISGTVLLGDGDRIGLGSAVVAHLRFQTGEGQGDGRVIRLAPRQRWTIGRAPDCDLPLAFEPTVSSHHASLSNREGHLHLIDNQSRNGTWVNGSRIGEHPLAAGDIVVIGPARYRFRLEPDGSLRVEPLGGGHEARLECVNLCCRAPGRGKERTLLLDQCTLSLQPGEFVGIIGPSGAGKTTLLTALAGITPPESGAVLCNQTVLRPGGGPFANAIGYVPQDDILHVELSVERSLDYLARLRLSPDVVADERAAIVDATIETLGLNQVRRQPVHQLSGGQRKRVSIGAELLVRPPLLFLDEPTAGLDPSVEERLMRHFRALADGGTTVVVTTHLLANLDLMDRLIVLAHGRVVFFGRPEEALVFFSEEERPLQRPAEIFAVLDSVEREGSGAAGSREQRAILLADRYLRSPLYDRHVRQLLSPAAEQLLAADRSQDPTLQPCRRRRGRPAVALPPGGRGRLSVSLTRSFAAWRTLSERHLAIRFASLRRVGLYLLLPLLLALATLSQTMREPVPALTAQREKHALQEEIHRGGPQLEQRLQRLLTPAAAEMTRPAADLLYALRAEGVANLPVPLSVLLMMVMTATFAGTIMACLEISGERTIYRRERLSALGIPEYLASKLPFCLAMTALQCFLFLVVCFRHPVLAQAGFLPLWLTMVAVAWTSVALGLLLSALDPSSGRFSVLLAIVAVLPQLLLSGGLGPDFYRGMPRGIRLAADLLPARWGLEMELTALYSGFGQEPLSWVPDLVREVIGFDYGRSVYYTGASMLIAQALLWLFSCAWLLKRRDDR